MEVNLNKRSHKFWLDPQGVLVKTEGILDVNLNEGISYKLICPILTSIFDDLIKLSVDDLPVIIPGVNLIFKETNGYFDYIFSRLDTGEILWELVDHTDSYNESLVRLQPEKEKALRDETQRFLDGGAPRC